jgi:hypothetical protein
MNPKKKKNIPKKKIIPKKKKVIKPKEPKEYTDLDYTKQVNKLIEGIMSRNFI